MFRFSALCRIQDVIIHILPLLSIQYNSIAAPAYRSKDYQPKIQYHQHQQNVNERCVSYGNVHMVPILHLIQRKYFIDDDDKDANEEAKSKNFPSTFLCALSMVLMSQTTHVRKTKEQKTTHDKRVKKMEIFLDKILF